MRTHDLVFVAENRLLAEAAGAALLAEGVISSFAFVRNGQENAYLATIFDEPNIVVVDVMPQAGRCDECSRIRRLAEDLPTSQIVAIGDCQSTDCIACCIESGASTFVLVTDSLDELSATVKALRDGHSRCSDAVIEVVLHRVRELSKAKSDEAGEEPAILTQREIEVLELVAEGLLNKNIARRLGIAVSTVKNHLHAVFEKLQVTGRRKAVCQAIAQGILRCEQERVVA